MPPDSANSATENSPEDDLVAHIAQLSIVRDDIYPPEEKDPNVSVPGPVRLDEEKKADHKPSEPWGRSHLTIKLCPDGDLILDVFNDTFETNAKVSFLVYSGALKAVSSVWRKMLDEDNPLNAKRSNDDGQAPEDETTKNRRTLMLEDDEPRAIALVLVQIHHRPDLLPASISMKEFLYIAVVCDKYDCALAMHWPVRNWLRDDCISPFSPLELHGANWLFIAETFGFRNGVDALVDALAKRIGIPPEDSDHEYTIRDISFIIKPLNTEYLPQRYLDYILQQRREKLAAIMSRVEATMDFLSDPQGYQDFSAVSALFDAEYLDETRATMPLPHFIMSYLESPQGYYDNCMSLAHGVFTRQLRKLALYDFVVGRKKPEEWKQSFVDFCAAASKVELKHDNRICPLESRDAELTANDSEMTPSLLFQPRPLCPVVAITMLKWLLKDAAEASTPYKTNYPAVLVQVDETGFHQRLSVPGSPPSSSGMPPPPGNVPQIE